MPSSLYPPRQHSERHPEVYAIIEGRHLAGTVGAAAARSQTTADPPATNAGAARGELAGDELVGVAGRDVLHGPGRGSREGDGSEDADENGGELHFQGR